MRPGVILTTFAVVFPAELPDKTALTALVLAARYRPRPVWAGAAAAFAVQCALAVAAGGALTLLPERAVALVAAVLFGAGAVLAWRGDEAEHADQDAAGEGTAATATTSAWRIAAIAAVALFVAEFGDFTQLATASLAGRYAAPREVFVGAWLALAAVAALAVSLGRGLLRVVPLRLVRRGAAVLFAVVAVVSLLDAAT